MDSLLNSLSLIDLSHSLHPNIPSWEPHKILSIEEKETFSIYSKHVYTLDGGLSTHIDSPLHFFKSGFDVSKIEIKKLFVRLILIDISEKCSQKNDYQLSLDDVLQYENEIQKIEKNDFIVVYTGWSKFWNNVEKYRGSIKLKKENLVKSNLDETIESLILKKEGQESKEECEYEERYEFPTVSKDTISFLIARDISGIGIDTLSPDIDEDFPVHKAILGTGRFIIENLNENLELLPKQGGYLIIAPLKIEGGGEAPTRVFALI